MTAIQQPYRYVSEAAWVPSYIGIAVITLGTIERAWLASTILLVALLAFRVMLELIYRFVLGDSRLQVGTQLIAFAAQVLVWAALWWYWKAS